VEIDPYATQSHIEMGTISKQETDKTEEEITWYEVNRCTIPPGSLMDESCPILPTAVSDLPYDRGQHCIRLNEDLQ
jgi:hypothetical protein